VPKVKSALAVAPPSTTAAPNPTNTNITLLPFDRLILHHPFIYDPQNVHSSVLPHFCGNVVTIATAKRSLILREKE
jgi:hypothetical protein